MLERPPSHWGTRTQKRWSVNQSSAAQCSFSLLSLSSSPRAFTTLPTILLFGLWSAAYYHCGLKIWGVCLVLLSRTSRCVSGDQSQSFVSPIYRIRGLHFRSSGLFKFNTYQKIRKTPLPYLKVIKLPQQWNVIIFILFYILYRVNFILFAKSFLLKQRSIFFFVWLLLKHNWCLNYCYMVIGNELNGLLTHICSGWCNSHKMEKLYFSKYIFMLSIFNLSNVSVYNWLRHILLSYLIILKIKRIVINIH